jgi:hypothetical protein
LISDIARSTQGEVAEASTGWGLEEEEEEEAQSLDELPEDR